MLTLPDAFKNLPDTARLWLVALDTPPPDAPRLMDAVAALVAQWRHKGHAYQGATALLHGQILAIAEPELAANPSGCAIDGLFRKVDRLLGELELKSVDPATAVMFHTEGRFRTVPKEALAGLLQDGALNGNTTVLDLSLYNLGDLRSGRLETPLARTWIGRKFKVA